MTYSQQLVDAQYGDRSSTNGGLPVERCPVPFKMLGPILLSWIEQRLEFIRFGIVAGRVWAFE